jgi:hypothetical protein
MKKALAKWNARAPEFLVITANGVSWETAEKTTKQLPWITFKRWREGKFVFLLPFVRGKYAQPLPKGDLSAQQVEEIRSMLDLFLRPSVRDAVNRIQT